MLKNTLTMHGPMNVKFNKTLKQVRNFNKTLKQVRDFSKMLKQMSNSYFRSMRRTVLY
jgi:hypothetical protein